MLTLYFSPQSRATRVLALLHELGIDNQVMLKHVTVPRRDGSGMHDLANPHPEQKVPALMDGDTLITESAAIAIYLSDMFPDRGMAPGLGDPLRGPYLTWMAYYPGVMEPVYNAMAAGQGDNPVFQAAFRGVPEVEARLIETFADGRSYLLGERMSAADLLVQSPYIWFRDHIPDSANVRAWVDRVSSRPSYTWAAEVEAPYL